MFRQKVNLMPRERCSPESVWRNGLPGARGFPTSDRDRDKDRQTEIIPAKTTFVQALLDSLEFKEPDLTELQTRKDSLKKKKFFSAYHAFNALDSFMVELNEFRHLGEIDKINETDQEKLLLILRGAAAIDGEFTKQMDYQFVKKVTKDILIEIREVRKDQQFLIEQVEEVKEDVEEVRKLCQDTLTIVKQNPERTKALLNEQLDELRQILLKTENELKTRSPEKAAEAKKWYYRLERPLGIIADVIEISTFLAGLPFVPALINTEAAKRTIVLLKRIRGAE